MEMYFRLLQKEHRWGVMAKKFGYEGQHLTDTVANINQIAEWPLGLLINSSDL